MEFDCLDVSLLIGFDWDAGNIVKNEKKHDLHYKEIEEIFFNEPLIVAEDYRHSESECRCFALGHTDDKKLLFVVFTTRQKMIRIISARMMNRKERKIYEEA